MAKATYRVDDEEDAAEARKDAAEALRTLAKIADSPTAKPKVREEARRSLEARLDDRFHETTQLHLWLSIHGMRPFRASHMIRTLQTLD